VVRDCVVWVQLKRSSIFAFRTPQSQSFSFEAARDVCALPPRCHQVRQPFQQPPSVVGLWDIQFIVDGQTIQEAFQNWNFGGTEAHNPNGDLRSGNICLGTWLPIPGGGFKLAHRVWNYDTNGNFLGTIRLNETIHLSDHGTTQTGSFKLDFYDPSGNFQNEVAGSVTGQRIQVE